MSEEEGGITSVGTEEAQSVAATSIGQFFQLLRTIVNYALKIAKELFDVITQHPEASLLTVANLCILFG